MSTETKNKIYPRIITGIILLAVGVIIGRYIPQQSPSPDVNQKNLSADVRAGGGKYTNPLLDCDQSQAVFVELAPFKDKVNSQISDLEKDQDISNISVYFRDMNNGPWFGISSSATFSPASLLKVPLAIAYYKLNEQSPGVLAQTITYTGPDSSWPNITQTIPPKELLTVGQAYSMDDLIKRMLSYSDNTAYYLLFSNIKQTDLQSVYNDFNLQLNGPGSADDSTVTVRGYSSFFRILFNASYLNRSDSEKVLSYLADSEFMDGLAAGVPSNVPIAHKFGERETTDKKPVEFHDCGIVYYPQHPYLLCVMTQGSDIVKQTNAIKQISSTVYNQVNSQNPGN